MEAYSIGRLLGQGAFGKALLVSRKSDGAELAMKQMAYSAMSAAEQKASLHEVSLLSRLKHPNIIGYHDAFLEDGQLCIVMELASGGSLEDELAKAQKVNQPLAEARLLDLFAQLADAVHYMHSCRVIHRDIKPANILLTDDGTPKLADFGISSVLVAREEQVARQLKEGERDGGPVDANSRIEGTPFYLAPELLDPTLASGTSQYSPASDVWATPLAGKGPSTPSEDSAPSDRLLTPGARVAPSDRGPQLQRAPPPAPKDEDVPALPAAGAGRHLLRAGVPAAAVHRRLDPDARVPHHERPVAERDGRGPLGHQQGAPRRHLPARALCRHRGHAAQAARVRRRTGGRIERRTRRAAPAPSPTAARLGAGAGRAAGGAPSSSGGRCAGSAARSRSSWGASSSARGSRRARLRRRRCSTCSTRSRRRWSRPSPTRLRGGGARGGRSCART